MLENTVKADIRSVIVKAFAERGITLPDDFDIHNLEQYCKKNCEMCWGSDGIEVKYGISLWQFEFCKGPYAAKEGLREATSFGDLFDVAIRKGLEE